MGVQGCAAPLVGLSRRTGGTLKNGSVIIAIGILSAVVMLTVSCIDSVSRHDMTVTRIDVIEQRIHLFWAENGKLPSTLAELRPLAGRDNKTTDAWGRELQYKVDGHMITLWSQGKQGGRRLQGRKPGPPTHSILPSHLA